jgi:hypothetical protein
MQQRALSAATLANDGDELTGLNFKIHSLEYWNDEPALLVAFFKADGS